MMMMMLLMMMTVVVLERKKTSTLNSCEGSMRQENFKCITQITDFEAGTQRA